MLHKILITLCLLTLSSNSLAQARILLINGYVEGLPFPSKVLTEFRQTLSDAVPGTLVHNVSLDIYRPRETTYKQQIKEFITTNYANYVDIVVMLDEGAIRYYDEYLSPSFKDTPVFKFIDLSNNAPSLGSNEYGLTLKPNYSETIEIATHHYPNLKNVYLVGTPFSELNAIENIKALAPNLNVSGLGSLSVAEMRAKIATLGEGDLLFYQLIFADGTGQPMVPPIKYLKEFAELSPVPTVCMYRNFIEQGCMGGSVMSAKDQSDALIDMIYEVAGHLIFGSAAPTTPIKDRWRTVYASQPTIDFTKLETFALNTNTLPTVNYLNQPVAWHKSYADELLIGQIITLILLIVLVGLYVLRTRSRRLLNRVAMLAKAAPVGLFWRDNIQEEWHQNERASHWAEKMGLDNQALLQQCLEHSNSDSANSDPLCIASQNLSLWLRIRREPDSDKPQLLVLEDVTEMVEHQNELKQYALTDPLTQLLNRRSLLTNIEHWISESTFNKQGFAVLMMDLDGFKKINDDQGHDIGDEVLIEVAKRLKHSVRHDDLVARLGGDEFCALIGGANQKSDLEQLSQKIIEAISHPITHIAHLDQGMELKVSISIGIALYPVDAGDTKHLLKQADMAMYEVKRNGKSNYRFVNDNKT